MVTCVTLAFTGADVWAPPSGGTGGALAFLLEGLPYCLSVVAILGAHEMGHYLACRYHRIPCSLPYFVPGIPPLGTFGALIRIRGVIPGRNALFDVAAAGPIAGFCVAVPILLVGMAEVRPLPAGDPDLEVGVFLGHPVLVDLLAPWFLESEHFYVSSYFGAAWVGLLMTSLNLFPVGQLDGGHVAYAWSRRVHRVLTHGCLAALAALIAFQALEGTVPGYLLWFAILLWMRDRHPRLWDEGEPLTAGRKAVALVLAVIFALCFIPSPFTVVGLR